MSRLAKGIVQTVFGVLTVAVAVCVTIIAFIQLSGIVALLLAMVCIWAGFGLVAYHLLSRGVENIQIAHEEKFFDEYVRRRQQERQQSKE